MNHCRVPNMTAIPTKTSTVAGRQLPAICMLSVRHTTAALPQESPRMCPEHSCCLCQSSAFCCGFCYLPACQAHHRATAQWPGKLGGHCCLFTSGLQARFDTFRSQGKRDLRSRLLSRNVLSVHPVFQGGPGQDNGWVSQRLSMTR